MGLHKRFSKTGWARPMSDTVVSIGNFGWNTRIPWDKTERDQRKRERRFVLISLCYIVLLLFHTCMTSGESSNSWLGGLELLLLLYYYYFFYFFVWILLMHPLLLLRLVFFTVLHTDIYLGPFCPRLSAKLFLAKSLSLFLSFSHSHTLSACVAFLLLFTVTSPVLYKPPKCWYHREDRKKQTELGLEGVRHIDSVVGTWTKPIANTGSDSMYQSFLFRFILGSGING